MKSIYKKKKAANINIVLYNGYIKIVRSFCASEKLLKIIDFNNTGILSVLLRFEVPLKVLFSGCIEIK